MTSDVNQPITPAQSQEPSKGSDLTLEEVLALEAT